MTQGQEPHRVIAGRMKELRKRRGWSAERLAQEMAAVGVPWVREIVANLENGRRAAVSVQELLALAYVLDVAPLHLMVPTKGTAYRIVPTRRPDAEGTVIDVVHLDDARRWIIGEQPLPETDLRVYLSEVDEGTFRERFGHGSAWAPGT